MQINLLEIVKIIYYLFLNIKGKSPTPWNLLL